jgi:hypothetical protein
VATAGRCGPPPAAGGGRAGGDMEITKRDRSRMNNKILQFFRFLVLNLKILKGVNHAKRS